MARPFLIQALFLAATAVLGVSARAYDPDAHVTQSVKPGPGKIAEKIDVVVDLDDTLFRWIREDESIGPGSMVIPEKGTIAGSDGVGYRYRALDGMKEFLISLSQDPNIRISFYSLGERARNESIVAAFGLPKGSVYKVLSLEDSPLAGPDGKRAKDLTEINSDLSKVIMVDDNPALTLPSQRGLVLHIGDKPAHYYLRSDESPSADSKWGRETPTQFVQMRNRLARAWTLLHRVLILARQGESTQNAIAQVNREIQSDPNAVTLYREGAQEFHRINPNYRFSVALPGVPIGCIQDQIRELVQKAGAASMHPSKQ